MSNKGALRLAFYLPDLSGGGAERVTLTMVGEMLKRGHAVDLIMDRTGGPLMGDIPPGAKVFSLASSKTLLSATKLARHLRRTKPDALISLLTHNNCVAVAARALSGVDAALLAWEHSLISLDHEYTPQRALGLALAKPLYAHVELVLCVSNAVADNISQHVKASRNKVRVLCNPIPASNDTSAPPHPWFSDGKGPVIVSAGRLTLAKDFATLVRAFSLLPANARLVILGEGPTRAAIEAQVKQLGLVDRVLLAGFQANPRAYMRFADMFVLSSHYEGFGNVLIEAMNCGTPVASTHGGGPPAELLGFGRYGPISPNGDAEALAASMRALLQSRPDPEFLKARGREYAPETIANTFEAYVRESLSLRAEKLKRRRAQTIEAAGPTSKALL